MDQKCGWKRSTKKTSSHLAIEYAPLSIREKAGGLLLLHYDTGGGGSPLCCPAFSKRSCTHELLLLLLLMRQSGGKQGFFVCRRAWNDKKPLIIIFPNFSPPYVLYICMALKKILLATGEGQTTSCMDGLSKSSHCGMTSGQKKNGKTLSAPDIPQHASTTKSNAALVPNFARIQELFEAFIIVIGKYLPRVQPFSSSSSSSTTTPRG